MRFWDKVRVFFGLKPRDPPQKWLMLCEPEGRDPIILGDFEGSHEDAMDACQAAYVNWQWREGGLKEGKMAMGRYGVMPIKRKYSDDVPQARVVKPHPNSAVLVGGERIIAHSKNLCEGRACCVHNPSDHHMKDFPQHWREDTGVMERTCPHGIGHPDPDDVAFRKRVNEDDGDAMGIHGCDGCCRPPESRVAT